MKKQDILENQAKKVYLALGSNLGNKRKNLELAKFRRNLVLKNLYDNSYINEAQYKDLKNKKIIGFSGIGRPEKFHLSLKVHSRKRI